jgi:hypothetical protein
MKFKESIIAIGLSTLGVLGSPESVKSQTVDQIKELRSGLKESFLVEDSPQIDQSKLEFAIADRNTKGLLFNKNIPTKIVEQSSAGRWIQDSNCGSYITKNVNGKLIQTFIIPKQPIEKNKTYSEFEGAVTLPQHKEQENITKKFEELGIRVEKVEGLYCEGGDILPFADNQNNTIVAYGRNTMLHNVTDYFLQKLPELDDTKINISQKDIDKWTIEIDFISKIKGSKFLPENYSTLTAEQKLDIAKRFARAEQLFISRFKNALHIKENNNVIEIKSDNFHIDTYMRFLPSEDKKYKGIVLLSDPDLTLEKLSQLSNVNLNESETFEHYDKAEFYSHFKPDNQKNADHFYQKSIEKNIRKKERSKKSFIENKTKLENMGYKVLSIPPEYKSQSTSFIPANGIFITDNGIKKYIITGFGEDVKFSNRKEKRESLRKTYDLHYNYLKNLLLGHNIKLEIIESEISKSDGSLNCLTVPILKN